MFKQDETRNFEGKRIAMAGAASSVNTADTPMAVENTVLVETIAEDRLVSSWPDYPCLYNIRSASFRNRDLRQQAFAELADKCQQSGTAQPIPLS